MFPGCSRRLFYVHSIPVGLFISSNIPHTSPWPQNTQSQKHQKNGQEEEAFSGVVMSHDAFPGLHFFSFLNLHLRMFVLILEREGGGEREKETSIGSRTHPDQKSNPQPGHVP